MAEPGRLFFRALFAPLFPVMAGVLRAHFHRIRVRLAGGAPVRGAALVVSNHPCTWVDAAVLDVALERRLHFLADDTLFRPCARGWFLRIYGTLPVSIDDQDPDHARRNAETFRRCDTLLDRGEAIAVFPEGVSFSDRGLLPLHLGAARMALGHRQRPGARRLALVPVSLHYADRSAFRSDVTVTVGPSLALDDPSLAGVPVEIAAERLTERISAALRTGLVDLERCGGADAALLESLAVRGAGPPPLEVAQALAAALEALSRRSPRRHRRLLGRARAYARARRALRVADRALATHDAGAATGAAVRNGIVTAAALGPALVGAVLHAVPLALIVCATRHYVRDPSHVALVRITAAFAILSLWYLLLALAIALATGSQALAAASMIVAAVTGAIAWRVSVTARAWADRARIARLARRNPRLVGRARALHAELRRDAESLLAGERA